MKFVTFAVADVYFEVILSVHPVDQTPEASLDFIAEHLSVVRQVGHVRVFARGSVQRDRVADYAV